MNRMSHNEGVWVVDDLEIERLPLGRKTRLMVELVHDGMGSPVSAPVLVARGDKPGPVFGVTAALHGDEINGIPVLHRLFERLDTRNLRGTVVGVVVSNTPSYLQNERRFEGDVDLNHVMPGRLEGATPEIYAHRLFTRLVSRFDRLVDLHTASAGRINSLYVRADLLHPTTAQMAYRQRPQIIVHNPPADGTLRGAAMAAGIPAITVEIGDPQRFQPELIRRSLAGLRAMLADAGHIAKRKLANNPPPILCERSYWLYTQHGGLLEVFPQVTERVKAGQVVARLTNIFGDLVQEYTAPEDGVVIGKSVNPVGSTGARVLHLGIECDLDDDRWQPQPSTLEEG